MDALLNRDAPVANDTASVELASAVGAISPALYEPLAGLRAWFVFFVAWMAGLCAVATTMFARYEQGDPSAMSLWLLSLMCFYLSLCNVMLPLPTSWIILLVASQDVGLCDHAGLRIGIVALCGAMATTIANLNEYHVLAFLLRFGLDRRIRATRVYGWALRWFDVSPFRTMALVAFVPIPVDAVRWLAILQRYPRRLFAASYFVGRTLRYAFLASVSIVLHLGTLEIVLIQVGIVVLLGARLMWALVRSALQRRMKTV